MNVGILVVKGEDRRFVCGCIGALGGICLGSSLRVSVLSRSDSSLSFPSSGFCGGVCTLVMPSFFGGGHFLGILCRRVLFHGCVGELSYCSMIRVRCIRGVVMQSVEFFSGCVHKGLVISV